MLRIDFGFFSVSGVWRAVLGVVGETSFLYFGCDEDVLRCANPVVMPLVSSLDIAGDDNYACTGHTLEFEGNSVVLGSNATATTKGGTIIPLPKPEVRVVAMEVTQGLQNWENTVTLVKNRRTAVRVFMETTAMRRKITAELKGSKVADSVKTEFDDSPRPPTNYERKVEVRSNVTERRGYMGSSFSWHSSLDGSLGAGGLLIIAVSDLSIGDHVITVTATDSDQMTTSASTMLTVNALNSAPEAVDDAASAVFGSVVQIDVFANDIDLENDAKLETLSIYAQPVLGTAKIVVAPSGLPVVEYIASNQGVDVFSYEMCDYGDRCDTAQVRVAVSEDTILGTTLDDTIY